MQTNIKTLPRKITTKQTGIYYKEIQKTVVDNDGKSKISITDKMFYIRYKDEHKKDIWLAIGKYSDGIREAYCKSKRTKILNQLRLGEQPEIIKKKNIRKEIIKLDDIFQLYKQQKRSESKDIIKTEQKYKSNIFKILGQHDIATITTDIIIKFRTYLLDKGLAPSTINNNIVFIGTLFNIAIEEKLYSNVNPTKTKKLKSIKTDNSRDRYLTTDDISQLFSTIKDDKVLTMFTKLSLTTGGRLETILNIQKKDIDISNHHIKLKDLKTNSTYTSFLTQEIISMIEDIDQELTANTYIVGINSIKYPTRTLQRKLQNILNDLFNNGLDKKDSKNRVVIHTLRHTFASHLAINGTPIFTIQNLMNHSDIKMTMRYAKLAPDSGKIAIQELYK